MAIFRQRPSRTWWFPLVMPNDMEVVNVKGGKVSGDNWAGGWRASGSKPGRVLAVEGRQLLPRTWGGTSTTYQVTQSSAPMEDQDGRSFV